MTLRRAFLLLVACAAAALAALAPGSGQPASAHALVETSSPADGATVSEPPTEVTIEFTEGVRVPLGSVRVVDSGGERVDDGVIDVAGGEVTVGLRRDLPDGTYTTAFRIISADGHPVRGGIVFAVGEGDPGEGVAFEEILGGGDTGWEVAAAVLRFAAYVGALLAAGGAVFLAVVRDVGSDRDRLARVVTTSASVAGAAAVLGIVAQAALATGLGASAVTESGVLGDVLADGLGAATAALLVGLAVAVAGARAAPRLAGRVAACAGAAVAAGSFALAGHTRSTDPGWLAIPADAMHVLAAAIWFGGLILLAVCLRRRGADDDPVGAAGVLSRFSALAAWTVAVLAVTGSALAWGEIRAMKALATTYGAVFVAKLAVAACVGFVASWNRWQLLPAVVADDAAGGRDRALKLLRRTVRVEAVGLVLLLAITAVLVNVTPARTAAGVGGVFSDTKPFGADYSVNLVVDPNQAGVNDVHLYFYDSDGAPVTDAPFETVLMRLSFPDDQIGPIEREPTFIVPGHYTLTGNELSIPGQWNIEVEARQGEFGQLTASFQVPVNQ